jgi:hypothetical protein
VFIFSLKKKRTFKIHHKILRYCSIGGSNQTIAYPHQVVLLESGAGIFGLWVLAG